MTFSVSWHTLLDELEALPDGATLITPLSHDRFRIVDIQEQRVIIEFLDRDIDTHRPLQRDQFEALYRNVTDRPDGFPLQKLPPDADPYPAVLSLYPHFEVDEDRGRIREHDDPTTSRLLDVGDQDQPDEESNATVVVIAAASSRLR